MKKALKPMPWKPTAKVLILGTFPSEESLKTGIPYSNPTNRFWSVIRAVFGWSSEELEISPDDVMLNREGVVLCDVIGECEREGSLDKDIKNPQPNTDMIQNIIDTSSVKHIILNGQKALRLFDRFFPNGFKNKSGNQIQVHCLPSTSAVNTRYTLDKLIGEWSLVCVLAHSG